MNSCPFRKVKLTQHETQVSYHPEKGCSYYEYEFIRLYVLPYWMAKAWCKGKDYIEEV